MSIIPSHLSRDIGNSKQILEYEDGRVEKNNHRLFVE
jgi:hypothetical protein